MKREQTINSNSQLEKLLKISFDDRDFAWEESFFKSLSENQLRLINDSAQIGPDGWPYLLTETVTSSIETPPVTEKGRSEASTQEKLIDSAQNIFHWLSQKGIGLVVNPLQEYPDYVFSYGMIWSFKETGYFIRPNTTSNNPGPVSMDLAEGTKISAGAPNDKFLPPYVRAILKSFFLDQGVLQPRILVMSTDQKSYDLVISLDSLKNPPTGEHQGILETIGWFLPPDYSIVLMQEQGLPPFVNL